MEAITRQLEKGNHNFIFLGEAGSGKSEAALNFAKYLRSVSDKPVHFFDMDMTKPLFRSRDANGRPELDGITFHYEEQFMDAPTLAGGVARLLKEDGCYVVMDVGGDDIGARAIGGFMAGADRSRTAVYYVMNAFRPWSLDLEHIDQTLGGILAVSHIGVEEIRLVNNPNLGAGTKVEDILEGGRRIAEMTAPYKPIDFVCAREELCEAVTAQMEAEVFPLHLFLTYPWVGRSEY